MSEAKTKAAPVPEVLARLRQAIPAPETELDHQDAWQLLVATILSAQSTDKTVNQVTPEVFARWPTPAALAEAPLEEVEAVVHRTGFFRRKAKAITDAARKLRDDFGGEVPRALDALVTLPGVARKTANLVLGSAYGVVSGVVVDTHAARVAQRLGLTRAEKPEEIEAALCAQLPREAWIDASHQLILHGRYVCTARRPACAPCPLNEVCPSREGPAEGTLEARAEAERRRIESRGGVTLSVG
jgi:endonuclease III